MKLVIFLVAGAVLIFIGFSFFRQQKSAQEITFVGIISDVIDDKILSGDCMLQINGKSVIVVKGRGELPLENTRREPRGERIEVGCKKQDAVGKRVEVYGKKQGDEYVTVYGSKKYYIIRVAQ